MGINANVLRLILRAQAVGVSFERSATIARQEFHLSRDKFIRIVKEEFGHPLSEKRVNEIFDSRYVDELLRYLGADEVHVFDYSDYEGATHIHDFNMPLPIEFESQYSAVIEAGSLEHVFNFPTALQCYMQLPRRGGHLLASCPANNYMGHGFYQFSPELFFRVFCSDNGYRFGGAYACEGRESETWRFLPDPMVVQNRIEIANSKPTLLLMMARRDEVVPLFCHPTLQSDYVRRWDSKGSTSRLDTRVFTGSRFKVLLPKKFKTWLKEKLISSKLADLFDPTAPGTADFEFTELVSKEDGNA